MSIIIKVSRQRLILLLFLILLWGKCTAQDGFLDMNHRMVQAVHEWDVKSIKECLKAGVDLNLEENSRSLGGVISSFNRPQGRELLEFCISKGLDVNRAKSEGGHSLLYTSLNRDYSDALPLLLLKHGANPRLTGSDGEEPLLLAAQLGFGSVIKELMRRGVGLNITNKHGQTALMFLAQGNADSLFAWPAYRESEMIALAKELIALGARPELRDKDGKNAADFAVKAENYGLAVFFDSEKRYAAKYSEIKRTSDLRKIRSILRRRSIARAENLPPLMPLDEVSAARDLLDTGIHPDIKMVQNSETNTLFEFCLSYYYKADEAMVQLMLERGADPNQSFPRYDVPLTAAANQPKIFQLLLDAGANPEVKLDLHYGYYTNLPANPRDIHASHLQEPLIHRLAAIGVPECLEMLKKRKVKLDEPDDDGYTPLMRAAEGCNATTARWLIDNGANLSRTNRFGQSPVDLLAQSNDISLLKQVDKAGKYAALTDQFPAINNSTLIGRWVLKTNPEIFFVELRDDGGGSANFQFWGVARPLAWRKDGNVFRIESTMLSTQNGLVNLKFKRHGEVHPPTNDVLVVGWDFGQRVPLTFELVRANP